MVNFTLGNMVVPSAGIKAATGLLVVDVQQRLAPAIPAAPDVVPRIAALIDKASELGLPILASEQYSRGLGETVPELRRRLPAEAVIEKIHFAAPREAAFAAALAASGLRHLVVAGMEAHVCVQQTVLALLAQGIAVTLAADAVASRRDLDRRVALARLARAGAEISDSAAVLARWPELSPAAP
jgi:nicotinamidase-related amidase